MFKKLIKNITSNNFKNYKILNMLAYLVVLLFTLIYQIKELKYKVPLE